MLELSHYDIGREVLFAKRIRGAKFFQRARVMGIGDLVCINYIQYNQQQIQYVSIENLFDPEQEWDREAIPDEIFLEVEEVSVWYTEVSVGSRDIVATFGNLGSTQRVRLSEEIPTWGYPGSSGLRVTNVRDSISDTPYAWTTINYDPPEERKS